MKAGFHRIVELQGLCDALQNQVNIQNDELYTSNNAVCYKAIICLIFKNSLRV